MITVLIIFILVVIVASTWWFGAWNNFLALVNVTIAALVASSFYENLAHRLMSSLPTYLFLNEFVSIWAIFAITFIVLRSLTDLLSKFRLKFDIITEMTARSLFSLGIAGVFISFTMFTLQLAPLPPVYFGDIEKDNPAATTIGPDRLWAGTVKALSQGALSASRDANFLAVEDVREFKIDSKPFDFEGGRIFDPQEKFFSDRATIRKIVSQRETLRAPINLEE